MRVDRILLSISTKKRAFVNTIWWWFASVINIQNDHLRHSLQNNHPHCIAWQIDMIVNWASQEQAWYTHTKRSKKQHRYQNCMNLTIVVFSPCSLCQDATITECSLAFTKPFPMIVTPAHVCQRDRSPVLTGLVGKT